MNKYKIGTIQPQLIAPRPRRVKYTLEFKLRFPFERALFSHFRWILNIIGNTPK